MDMPAIIHQIEQCAPSAPTAIIEAIIRTESGLNPLAMHVNRDAKLARQPASRKEAEVWARWLLVNGHSFDAGLMQINSANWEKLGLTPDNVFDVCENIRAGAKLFSESYSRAAATVSAARFPLTAALSAYNTGDFTSGVRNGYVTKVIENIGHEKNRMQEESVLGLAESPSPGSQKENTKNSAGTDRHYEPFPCVDTTLIEGFTTLVSKPWLPEPCTDLAAISPIIDRKNRPEQNLPVWKKEL
jgi:hypothetical protein